MGGQRTGSAATRRRLPADSWGAAVYLTLLTAVVTATVWVVVLRQYLDGYCTGGAEAVDGQLAGWSGVRCEYGQGPLTIPDQLPLLWSLAALAAGVLASAAVWVAVRAVVRRRER